MNLLKRPEVWLLLVISLGAVVYVFMSDAPADGNAEVILPEETPAAVVIHRCTLERDFGNARLDIELRYRNASPRTLILQPPDARLLTGNGKEVPPFILPVEKPPQIAAQTTQDVRLRYWLEKDHLHGALTLDIRGQTAEVKTAETLELEKLENRKTQTWTGKITASPAGIK